ncbi:MAG: thiamine-phosphate kinase [Chthoniobacteraceae bacterium]
MKLAGYGEDRLVRELTQRLAAGRDVRVGIGDDCAVIGRKTDAQWQLLKTDCIIEGVHFLKNADPKKVGRKALGRALSDMAAMGGKGWYGLVTLGIPADMEVTWLKGFYKGLSGIADKFGVSIVGGETARSPGAFFCSIALTGTVDSKHCITRSGGQPGDRLYVTGMLGGSIRGKHLTFTPRVEEAQWLAKKFPVHAMMDLSDGLGSDLPRLAQASNTGFMVYEEKIPLTKGCTTQNALADGEDYELLFAIAPRDAARLETAWKKRFPKLRLTHIGDLSRNFEPATLKSHGYDHFA